MIRPVCRPRARRSDEIGEESCARTGWDVAGLWGGAPSAGAVPQTSLSFLCEIVSTKFVLCMVSNRLCTRSEEVDIGDDFFFFVLPRFIILKQYIRIIIYFTIGSWPGNKNY